MDLTQNQIDFLRSTVRLAYRRQIKGKAALARKYGDEFDPTEPDARLAFIREVYQAIGGNPDNITETGRKAKDD